MLVYKIAEGIFRCNFVHFNGGATTYDKSFYLAAATDTASMLATFIPLILMIVVFYFLLIRPQKKRDKEVQKMRENIEIADEIVTIGGIIGRIVSIKDDTIVIETAGDRSKIRLARWSIQQNITATERAAQEQAANKENKK